MPFVAGNVKWGTPILGTPSGPITWSANLSTTLASPTPYSAAQFDAALVNAFDTWESVASVDFQPVAPGATPDLTIIAGSLGGSVAGTASYSYTSGPGLNQILSGQITFSSDLTWSPTGTPSTADFEAVALHEIGHILGLFHVNDPTEIMNPVVYVDTLGSGDIAGMQYLYGRDPSDAPTPPGEGPAAGPSAGVSSDGGGGARAGLLLGVLAALMALLFGGGAAAGALLAGRVPGKDDDAHDDPHDNHDHGDIAGADGTLIHSHAVYVPDLPLPAVAFDDNPGVCGCYGPCDCSMTGAAEELFV